MSDYLFLMESRLSAEQWRVVSRMQAAANSLGMTLYLVGGAIRDLICGFPIEDLDFVAEGKALQLAKSAAHDGARVFWQSDTLQAAEMEFPSGVMASVAMARSETYSDGGPPLIAAAPIMVDLKRRDFSINAIGVSLNPQSRGLLLDPTNGLGDIERKEIRVLHNRSFINDPVRMFRVVRFRAHLHFTLEQKTAALYQAAKQNHLQNNAAADGLIHELRQIARERNPAETLKALEKEDLLTALHPHLGGSRLDLRGITQAAKAAQSLAQAGLHPPSFELFLHLLISKLPPRDQAQLIQRLELKRPEVSALQKLESSAKDLAKELMGKGASSPTRLYNLLASTPSEVIVLLQTEYPQVTLQARIKTFLQKYLPLRAHLPSKQLEEMGVPAGSPRHQQILDAYFYAAIEGKLHGKNDQQNFLKKMAAPKDQKPAAAKRRGR